MSSERQGCALHVSTHSLGLAGASSLTGCGSAPSGLQTGRAGRAVVLGTGEDPRNESLTRENSGSAFRGPWGNSASLEDRGIAVCPLHQMSQVKDCQSTKGPQRWPPCFTVGKLSPRGRKGPVIRCFVRSPE